MSELMYSRNGDYLIPDLTISEQSQPIGKYGRLRRTYLKEHRPTLYTNLLLQEKLYPHLLEIEQTAQSRLEWMMPDLMAAVGVTEALKASDPMKWVGLINNLRAQVEETIYAELIYS